MDTSDLYGGRNNRNSSYGGGLNNVDSFGGSKDDNIFGPGGLGNLGLRPSASEGNLYSSNYQPMSTSSGAVDTDLGLGLSELTGTVSTIDEGIVITWLMGGILNP